MSLTKYPAKALPALTLTAAMLQSNVAEPGVIEAVWLPATAYAVGAEVILTTTHRRYSCTAACTGVSPDASVLSAVPKWVDIGSTNRWAMFDLYRNTATQQASPLTTTITPPGRVDAVAVLATNAATVQVDVYKAGALVFTRTKAMQKRRTTRWSEYFFGVFTQVKSLVIFDLPPITGGQITITQTLPSGVVTCGAVVLGRAIELGLPELGADVDDINFSTISRDTFGGVTLIPRPNIPTTTQTLWLPKQQVDAVRQFKKDTNAVPVVWSVAGDNQDDGYFESVLILGIYRKFSLNLTNQTMAKISLTVEEM